MADGDDKTLIQLIGHMFPRYGSSLLSVQSGDTDARVVRMRRICCEEFFDLYFTQSTETLAITQQEILKTVRITDAEALRRYTDGLVQEERRNAYVVHLPHYLRDISEEMLPEFFYEMLWLSRLPESKTPKDRPFQRSFFHECCYCALRILAQMEDDHAGANPESCRRQGGQAYHSLPGHGAAARCRPQSGRGKRKRGRRYAPDALEICSCRR